MDQPVVDRRVDARFPAGSLTRRATLRPGCVVELINWSAGGALVQAPRPLRPGARVHLHVVTERGKFSVAARVLRCIVSSLDADTGVVYRGALQFEDRSELFREETTRDEAQAPTSNL